MVVNPTKSVALPSKGHAPTVKEISLLRDARIADEGIGPDRYRRMYSGASNESTKLKDRGADYLARCLADMPERQAAALIAIESFRQRTSYLERALEKGAIRRSSPEDRQRGAVGVRETHRAAECSELTAAF